MRSYIKLVFYSEDDEGFIAVAPELPLCSAFGDTEEEALAELRVAIDLHLEVRQAEEREGVVFGAAPENLRYISARGEREKKLIYEENDAFLIPSYS